MQSSLSGNWGLGNVDGKQASTCAWALFGGGNFFGGLQDAGECISQAASHDDDDDDEGQWGRSVQFGKAIGCMHACICSLPAVLSGVGSSSPDDDDDDDDEEEAS